MPKCTAKIATDDPSVHVDMAWHIARGRKVPDTVECVWPAGHPQHHSSESCWWDREPGDDVVNPNPTHAPTR